MKQGSRTCFARMALEIASESRMSAICMTPQRQTRRPVWRILLDGKLSMSPTARSRFKILGLRRCRAPRISRRNVSDCEAFCHLWNEKPEQADHIALLALRLVMLAQIPLPRGFDVRHLPWWFGCPRRRIDMSFTK